MCGFTTHPGEVVPPKTIISSSSCSKITVKTLKYAKSVHIIVKVVRFSEVYKK